MVDHALPREHETGGPGTRVLVADTASMQNDDTYDTGHSNIVSAQVTASGDGNIATVTSTSSGTLTLGLLDDAGANVTSDETVHIFAVCER